MVIDYLDVFGVSTSPAKANTELIVNTNAPLAGPIALELLEPIAWRRAKIIDAPRQLDLFELPKRRTLDVHKSGDPSGRTRLWCPRT